MSRWGVGLTFFSLSLGQSPPPPPFHYQVSHLEGEAKKSEGERRSDELFGHRREKEQTSTQHDRDSPKTLFAQFD